MSAGSHTALMVLMLAGLSVASPTGNDTSPLRRLPPCEADLLAPCTSWIAKPVPNGCPTGVPSSLGSADFTLACQKHFICYYTIGTKADDCNNWFLNDLITACETTTNFFCKPAVRAAHAGFVATADFYHGRAQQGQRDHECWCFGASC
mmetsp:Transcript_16332/g.39186  ORF Transcript_16332/g.39186 Transcript_16332/m.39186 type:complete len:149 (-) Transcript_16332:1539-1985(-)